MKLYLCGRMRGLPDLGFALFHHHAKALRDLGHEVFNPAESNVPHDLPDHEYMALDLPHIARADAVACLRNWSEGKLTHAEVAVARLLHKPVLWADTLKPIERETVLEEAARLTSYDREKSYGHPRDDFACIAGLWNNYINKALKDGEIVAFCPRDVAMMMILVKVARDANKPGRDNLVDIAGYARCAERLEEVISDG